MHQLNRKGGDIALTNYIFLTKKSPNRGPQYVSALCVMGSFNYSIVNFFYAVKSSLTSYRAVS